MGTSPGIALSVMSLFNLRHTVQAGNSTKSVFHLERTFQILTGVRWRTPTLEGISGIAVNTLTLNSSVCLSGEKRKYSVISR